MRKVIFWLLVLLLAAYLLWRWYRGDQAGTADRSAPVFYDRLWVDHLPRSETDTIKIFAAITEEPIGLFQSTSAWRGDFELFRHRADADGRVSIFYPQTKERDEVKYRAWKCKEREFTFCMEIEGASRGTRRYYSQDGWEIGGVASAQALQARARLLLAPR